MPADAMPCGDLEDIRPCDLCGADYVFLLDSDPGRCPPCLQTERAIDEADRAARRERRLIEADMLTALRRAGLRWVRYARAKSARLGDEYRWHLAAPAGDRLLTPCSVGSLSPDRVADGAVGVPAPECKGCAAFARRHALSHTKSRRAL